MRRSHHQAGTRARISAATARRQRHVKCLVVLHTIAPKESPVSRERRSAVRLKAACAPGPTAACACCSDMSFVLNKPAAARPAQRRGPSQLYVDVHDAHHASLTVGRGHLVSRWRGQEQMTGQLRRQSGQESGTRERWEARRMRAWWLRRRQSQQYYTWRAAWRKHHTIEKALVLGWRPLRSRVRKTS
jgi:hypothetical protein